MNNALHVADFPNGIVDFTATIAETVGPDPESVVTDIVIDGNTFSGGTEFTSNHAGTVIDSDALGMVFGRPSALPDEVGVNAFPDGTTSSIRVGSTPD